MTSLRRLREGRSRVRASTCSRFEPLPAQHPLWTMENVLLTPHVAVADAEDIAERRYALLADNARRFLAGEPLRNVVDKARWY